MAGVVMPRLLYEVNILQGEESWHKIIYNSCSQGNHRERSPARIYNDGEEDFIILNHDLTDDMERLYGPCYMEADGYEYHYRNGIEYEKTVG